MPMGVRRIEMKVFGRRIYADKTTGVILSHTGDLKVLDDFERPSIESDFQAFYNLIGRDPESVIILELEPGQYAEEFATCDGFRVNPETQKLEFSYPDPNNPEPEEPVHQRPLTDQVEELKQAVAELTMLMAAAPTA